ncbi:MAG: protein translocase SEC61 complex subunit gamma [Candidatus Micrarchaeota archaeon]
MFDISVELRKMVRVLSVATRPRQREFMRMAKVTAAGIILIGLIGVIVSFLFERILK